MDDTSGCNAQCCALLDIHVQHSRNFIHSNESHSNFCMQLACVLSDSHAVMICRSVLLDFISQQNKHYARRTNAVKPAVSAAAARTCWSCATLNTGDMPTTSPASLQRTSA